MSENIARAVELEGTAEEDLADDVIFEPSLVYADRRTGIAIKDGIQVCWCCHAPVSGQAGAIDALLGEGSLVRICQDEACRRKVGEKNRKRDEDARAGNIIQLADLSEEQKVELVEEIQEKKAKYRGF